MKILRSILPVILMLVTTLLVSCGGPTASAPPTYTPEKLAQIQTYRISVDRARDRMSELSDLIAAEDWVDTRNFIHGPLGLLRRDMTYLSNALLEEDTKQALPLAKEVFNGLDDIDAAAKESNYPAAANEFKQVISNFDAYLDLIPQTEEEAEIITETEQTAKLIPDTEEVKEIVPDIKEVQEIIPDTEEVQEIIPDTEEVQEIIPDMEING